jgi:glycosyltransferase involved in cell wall biosynthesis
MPEPVSLYIITFNDADNLRAVLPTVLWADEVVVADSFSTDDTAAICAQFGVRHVNIKFEGFGKLRNDTLALLHAGRTAARRVFCSAPEHLFRMAGQFRRHVSRLPAAAGF